MSRVIIVVITKFQVLNLAPDGTPVIIVQWTRPDWKHGPTEEHLAWVYGDWVKALLQTIGADSVKTAVGTEIQVAIGASGWMDMIGHPRADRWWKPRDWFDKAMSKGAEAWN